jgi:photosystem II stability/assembly factor-like uncharacterized protein
MHGWRWWVSSAVIAATAGVAMANGRPPAANDVQFRPGGQETIVVPATFGVFASFDGGATFAWMCEESIGYGGTFDPDIAVHGDGVIYATTSDSGLRATRDSGCTWELVSGPFGANLVSQVEIGPDGSVWAAASAALDNSVYVSRDDGQTFTATSLVHDEAFWISLRTAPSDLDRVYVSGYVVSAMGAGDAGPPPPYNALYRTADGGDTWTALPTDDFALNTDSRIVFAGVSPTDPDLVFARVDKAAVPIGDAIYRSTDGGDTWTNVVQIADAAPAFAIRSDGTSVIAGSRFDGVRVSTDAGQNWTRPAQEPYMGCVGERADGVLFSCGSNWAPDFFALARSDTWDSWQSVFAFADNVGPVSCDAGTIQHDTCEVEIWPELCMQMGICPVKPSDQAAPVVDAPSGRDGRYIGPPKTGCDSGCQVGLLGVLVVLLVPYQRRRLLDLVVS